MRSFLLVSALCLAATPAAAQDWALDVDASSVRFTTEAFGGALEGRFETFDAEITLDPEALGSARIDAVVDTDSLAGVADNVRTPALGDDGLAPDEYPQARFVSEDITRTETGYLARGVLTLRDQSQPVELPFTLDITDGRAVAEGELVVVSAEFGLGEDWGENAARVVVRLHIEADASQ